MEILETIRTTSSRILFGSTSTDLLSLQKSPSAITIGILGAAAIAPAALINPAKTIPDILVYAVAARSFERAEEYAKTHGIPKVHSNYEDLINDPKIDAVYIPLPNAFHVKEVLACIKANKHVLCEKPLGANMAECRLVLEELKIHPSVHVVEAFHYRTHPAALLFQDLLANPSNYSIPKVKKITKAVIKLMTPFPVYGKDDIRYNHNLGGGCMMHYGCYAINVARKLVFKSEPINVISAVAKIAASDPNIDEVMEFQLEFPGGGIADIQISFVGPAITALSHAIAYVGVSAISEDLATNSGPSPDLEFTYKNFFMPSLWNSVYVKNIKTGKTLLSESKLQGDAKMPTFWHQLKYFTKLVQGSATTEDKSALTFIEDSLENMKTIDLVYAKAGMKPRVGLMA
ncbi:hypothetical protein HK096_004377 [Nowakowskiella sp. JEL0078]|nr:hypothetical protein HK096_004377 [Nowakowskiella sp. JEL0078]